MADSLEQPSNDGVLPGWSRRGFVWASLAFLAACNSPTTVSEVPAPDWPIDAPPSRPTPMPFPRAPQPAAPRVPATPPMPNVVPRAKWAKATPDYSRMDRMLPIKHVTLHHDALSPFTATDAASSQARVELIRVSHRNRNWADIGYHFVIDRAGRIYEGRPITWQGAHVEKCNEGNIGILCMGNFEVQSPTDAQLGAMVAHIKLLRARYKMSAGNIRSHREWQGAQTLCPGVNMQKKFVALRSNKAFG